MTRYKITVVVESDEDDPSRVLDAVQDRWDDLDWAGPELSLDPFASVSGDAVTIEELS